MIGPHQLLSIAPSYAGAQSRWLPTAAQAALGGDVATIELGGVLDKPTMREARGYINALAADTSVRAVTLCIDSPGGTVAGTGELAAAVARLAAIKPVTAVCEDLCASAAYYFASQATRIIATPNTVVGSIGVYTVLTDASKMFEKLGLEAVVIKSGKYKGGTYGAKLTAEEIDEVQRIIDGHARNFAAAVARGRKLSPQKVAEIADGRVFLGHEALAAGLVDEICDADVALANLRQAYSEPYGHLRGIAAATKFADLVATEYPYDSSALPQKKCREKHPRLAAAAAAHEAQLKLEKEREESQRAFRLGRR
jgi:signal peptide peptidase SppA